MKKEISELLKVPNDKRPFSGNVSELFFALSKIARKDKNMIKAETLGKITALLVSLESAPGGPYYSRVPENSLKKKGEIDYETNRAIAEFLSLYGVCLPKMAEYMPKPETEGSPASSWKSGFQNKTSFFASLESIAEEKKEMSGVRQALERKLCMVPAALRAGARRAFWRTVRGNPDKQMPLIGFLIKKSLGRRGKRISKRLLEEIGVINTFFWSAFIIYDDFWDLDEAAAPALLPVANMFSRLHAEFFSHPEERASAAALNLSASRAAEFRKFFLQLMGRLDAANAWEIKHCRAKIARGIFRIPEDFPGYGDYSKKYEPASGHILGPLLLLALLGEKLGGECARNLERYFKHLLISMQMLDDMHDFEEDLKRGHLSTAVWAFLRKLPRGKKEINLKKELPEAKKLFWFSVLPKLAEETLSQCRLARAALSRAWFISCPEPLLRLLLKREKAAKEALLRQADSITFLKSCNFSS